MNIKLLKLLLMLLVCIPIASTDILVPALPIITEELHTFPSFISLVLSSYMLGFSISLLTAGSLSDIYGHRVILLFTFGLYTLACLGIVLSTDIISLILLRFFQGLGGGSGFVIGRLIVKDYFDGQQQFNMLSKLSSSLAIVPAIAPQIGELCIKFSNWKTCFSVSFLGGLFILYLLFFKFKETNIKLKTQNSVKSLPFSFVPPFKNRVFLGFSIIVSFSWCAYFNFIGLSSFLFQNKYGYSTSFYALMLAVVTCGYLIGTTCSRFLYKKQISLVKTIQYGVYVCAINALLLVFGYFRDDPRIIVVAMMFMRFGIGLLMPTSHMGVMQLNKNNTGWYLGWLFFTQFSLGGITLYIASIVDNAYLGLGMVCSIVSSCIILFYGLSLISEKTPQGVTAPPTNLIK